MASRGSYSHEKALLEYLNELREQGWKTINLKGFSPDGIAVKDNKIVAIEILTIDYNSKASHTASMKKDQYFMFDDVFVRKVKRDKHEGERRDELMYKLAKKVKVEEEINDKWKKYESGGI